MQECFLSRDVLAHHVEAYFLFVYPIPGYDFFHKPSMLEDLHNDRIPPALCIAICASVAAYVSGPKESTGRQLSIQWAKHTDHFVFSNMNDMNTLNLQLIALSLLQSYAYRQFGRVWLMLGMATRLALGMQLNKSHHPGPSAASFVSRECTRRLLWGLFIQDKLHAGGIEDFVALPRRILGIPLPMDESSFNQEQDSPAYFLSDDIRFVQPGQIDINGYMAILTDLRYETLRTTKKLIVKTESPTKEDLQLPISSLKELEQHFLKFYRALPPHLVLSDRNIFALSSAPALTTYTSLHTWYLQTGCDLYRICLPGESRESASAKYLANASWEFIAEWQARAVSFAVKMSTTWQRLLDMKRTRALIAPGSMLLMDPAACVSIHQCTKILLSARRWQLYWNLKDPLSGDFITLDDKSIDQFCKSNLSFLDDLASIIPMAATVQRDVAAMVEKDNRDISVNTISVEQPPVTSEVQREQVLSRYNTLAMGVAASSPSVVSESVQSPATIHQSPHPMHTGAGVENTTDVAASTSCLRTSRASKPDTVELTEPLLQTQQPREHDATALHQYQYAMSTVYGNGLDDQSTGPSDLVLPSDFMSEYSVQGSQYDMGGELDAFIANAWKDGDDS